MNATTAANLTINDPVDAVYRLEIVSLLAALIGILAGLVAYVLYDLIGLFTNLAYYHEWSFHFRSPEHTPIGPWIIVTPVVGGMIIGFMAKYGSEKIKGHGIPEAMEAVLTSRSRIEAKVAILKPLSAAIAIGTGGPSVRKGQSFRPAARWVRLSANSFHHRHRKQSAARMRRGAGMAATFNTPIAGVILAIELLLFEFRVALLHSPGHCVHARHQRPRHAAGPALDVHDGQCEFRRAARLSFLSLWACSAASPRSDSPKLLYWVEDQFERLPIDDLWHPAIGALGLGIIGFFVPRVLGVGYDTISDILNNNLALKSC